VTITLPWWGWIAVIVVSAGLALFAVWIYVAINFWKNT